MGLLFSGFQRERPSDALHRLACDIKRAKLDIVSDKQRRRRVMLGNLGFFLVVYPIVLVCLVLALKLSWWMAALYTSPIILLFVGIHTSVKFYFDWDLKRNIVKLNELREEKKKILDGVKNTESYNVARELLDAYDNSDDEGDLHSLIQTQNNVSIISI